MSLSVTLLLIVALLAANLPFLNHKVFGVWNVPRKHFLWRLFELFMLYLLLGCFAYVLEKRLTLVQPKHWHFYVTTISLFLVFAFPGYVYCYIRRR